MTMPLTVPGFGGGVAIEGAADTRLITEVLKADAFDIQRRGALVAASDRTNYLTLLDRNGVPLLELHGLFSIFLSSLVQVAAIGLGLSGGGGHPKVYTVTQFDREGDATPRPLGFTSEMSTQWAPPGIVVTSVPWPGTFQIRALPAATQSINIHLVCLGAREGFTPSTAPGLFVVFTAPPATALTPFAMDQFDPLGTGPDGELAVGTGVAGTHAQQIRARGVVAFNNFVFVWGFDNNVAGTLDGPNRVMFSNLGNPLKWGNDNLAAVGVDRAFTDSDAIVLGDAGEIIRGAIKWLGRLWFGTNQQLHYIGGSDRDSFLTDGATPVQKAFNIVGPYALLEGPDRALYGLADIGLWRTMDGSSFEDLFLKLVDFSGRSLGYWDLLWTDPSLPLGLYPGATNQDLCWLVSDLDRRQVIVGIPFCSSANGFGPGNDTVVIKYHVDTKGFTRQVFLNVNLTAVLYRQREGGQREIRLLGTGTPGQVTVQRYAYEPVNGAVPVMPAPPPIVEFGTYAPFGPDGKGVVRELYLTLAWDGPSALPLVFALEYAIDQVVVEDFLLSIQPTAPGAPDIGDFWLDTSQSDASIGNGTATATVPALLGFLLKLWSGSAWMVNPGLGAEGTRVTLTIPVRQVSGVRYTLTATTLSAAGRFQWENLGTEPGAGSPAA